MIENRSYLLLAFQYMDLNLSDFMSEFHERPEYDPQVPKVDERCGQRCRGRMKCLSTAL